MHIVLDTRILETSTGRYMQRLLEHINDNFSDDGNHYTALIPNDHVEKWQKRLPAITIVAADQKWYTFAEQWSLFLLLRRLKPDLMHFTMPQQPLLWFGPAVTTIHDMTLIRFDNISSRRNPYVYRVTKSIFMLLLRIVMYRSKAVIVPTNFVKNDLADVFGKKYLDKIHVTYEAGEIPVAKPKKVPQLAEKKFIFFIGNAYPYKNVWKIVEAFKELKKEHPDLHLALAGKKDVFYQDIEQKISKEAIPDIHVLGFVSDGEKRWLFAHSVCFVTASLSEGFCIPLLEAMTEGTPVVAANASCLPEVVDDAGILFDPSSAAALSKAIDRIIISNDTRIDLVRRGKKRVNSFSWGKMTRQTHAIYIDILKS